MITIVIISISNYRSYFQDLGLRLCHVVVAVVVR